VLSVLGVVLLAWIGVQPPNEKALIVTSATIVLLVIAWWLGVRRFFAGPPIASVASQTAPDTSRETVESLKR